ncbi:hypothetical protein [Legionella septentrionalis]|uniref:Uncharacterized protein n=1 Tax=Legionella septentrionalis TaxID=2498109 RepID=A0A3S0VAB9_9GAMM|nr:hypothetical protein [Legionella septentrionalis]RUQ85127.1 hypothetical protein EKM59_07375 [Legionella septentrionalis]
MDENYVAYKLEADEVGLKHSSERVTSNDINEIRQKIDQKSKKGSWVIFKKNGNQYEPFEVYKP